MLELEIQLLLSELIAKHGDKIISPIQLDVTDSEFY